MPQLGGLQILKLAREHNKPAPATILLADHLSNTLLHDALSHSVFTVLTKPVNHDQLLDAMARAMKRFHNSLWPT
jgi:DNA-binding NtrC family response regulator